ncbi:MAG: thioredoxin family protein [Bacillota bacterium]|jgi:thioredoxin
MGEGGAVSELTSKALGRLSGDRLAVVDFWAPWCGPCKRLAPIYEQVALDMVSRFKGQVQFYKVNVDNESGLAETYGIMTIPTVIGFSGGKPLERFSGKTKEELAQWVEKLALQVKLS